jgi:hypothetical protein
LRSWFLALRRQADRYIELLRLRLNTVEDFQWSDQRLLFNPVEEKPDTVATGAPEEAAAELVTR